MARIHSTDQEAIAARVRAAQGYSGMKHDDFAKAVGVSPRTLGRMKAEGDNTLGHEQAIAAAAGVPLWFIEGGWDAGEQLPGDSRSIARYVETRVLAAMRVEFARLTEPASKTEQPPAETAPQDSPSRPQFPPRKRTDEASG